MSAVHDLCRQRLVTLQARWLELNPSGGKRHTAMAAAMASMSRERLTEAILAADKGDR